MNILIKYHLAMTALSLILVLSSIAVSSCSNRGKTTISNPLPQTQSGVTIPVEYSSIYTNLKYALDQFSTSLDKQGEPRNPTIFGAELLPANIVQKHHLLFLDV